jgi:hypothetical protein
MTTVHETEGAVTSLHCSCGATWTFKDGAVEYKSGKPQQRKPLTDEQIEMIWTVDQTSADDCASLYYAKVIARAIEAAHGIKD